MIEPNVIYNENCLDTMSRMSDGSIDLVVTSPPYDNLRDYSGDVVYDPFLGSGTTAKMAKLNGRNFVGSEISEEYCKVARGRTTFIGD